MARVVPKVVSREAQKGDTEGVIERGFEDGIR